MVTKAKRKSSGSIRKKDILSLTPKDWEDLEKQGKRQELHLREYKKSQKAKARIDHLNNLAFGSRLKQLNEEVKSVPKNLRGDHGEVTFYDGTMAQVVDSEGVTLWARVGMVFHGNKVDKEPGVWLQFQSKFMASELEGPVLLSMKTWNQLTRLFNKKANRQRRKKRK
jgi:hypothetical protein